MEYKAYGYIRIFLYVLGCTAGAFIGSFFLFILARIIPFLRILGLYLWLDMFVITLLSMVAGFWLVNHFLIVPFNTTVHDLGIVVEAPNHPEEQVRANWNELDKFVNLGFGTYLTARTNHGRYYRIILGKDTNGYYRMVQHIRRNYERTRAHRWHNN